MPRKPRIHFPGAVYHVILRGNDGQDTFFDEADRSRFFFLLQGGTERFRHSIHAFCLMSNHIHLAVQVKEIPLSRIMQNLGFRYTQYFNRRYKKTGHLFQGRYKALLIDADNYLLELMRYIHLNPNRAGMVTRPESYPWSSHRAYLGREKLPWLTTDWILGQFANAERYQSFIEDGVKEGYRKEFHVGSFEGRALGDDRFIGEALFQAEEPARENLSLDALIESVCRAYGLSKAELASRSRVRQISEARAMAALFVRETEMLMMVDLGREIKQDVSSLSQAARRLEMRIESDSHLEKRFREIQSRISNPQLSSLTPSGSLVSRN
ncbi:MAG: transposase [Thermodesulfobacteriota bacterium]|nr:transposase [Thermodesulfobacteriota bacterium]